MQNPQNPYKKKPQRIKQQQKNPNKNPKPENSNQ